MLVIGLSFTSCKSDDDSLPSNPDVETQTEPKEPTEPTEPTEPAENSELLGKWQLTSITSSAPNVTEADDCDKKSTVEFTETVVTFKSYYTNDEGKCEGEGDENSKYSTNGDTITYEEDDSEEEPSTYTVEGNTLKIMSVLDIPSINNEEQIEAIRTRLKAQGQSDILIDIAITEFRKQLEAEQPTTPKTETVTTTYVKVQ